MSAQSHRAILVINYSTKRSVPTDISAKLREDLLGTGIYPTTASIQNYESETGVLTVSLDLAVNDGFAGDPSTIAQAFLDKKYGVAPIVAELEEQEEEAGNPANEVEAATVANEVEASIETAETDHEVIVNVATSEVTQTAESSSN